MDLRDFTDMGNDIGRRVTDAINTGNYSQLSRDIKRRIEQAFTGNIYDGYDGNLDGKLYREPGTNRPSSGFDRCDPYGNPEMYRGSNFGQARPRNEGVKYRRGIVPITSKPPKKGGPVAMMIVGYVLAAIFGITGIGLGLMMIPVAAMDAVATGILGASAGLMVPFMAGGLALGIVGTKKYGTAKRFESYCNTLADGSFSPIKKLAAGTHKNEQFTVKDLQKMIDRGYFPEGHIDDKKTCFIGTEDTYRQYVQTMENAAKAKAAAEAEAMGFKSMPDDLRQVIEEGNAYIKSIREANDAIPDEVISEKLYRMENIVRRIFEYVRENPDQVDQLRRFMSYYMPTTEKLVKAYQQMDMETIQGRNMTKAKEEIAETLDTINEAYEKLYDSMYVDVAMDVSSDISVLKTMFAREGLTKDELNGGNKDE